MHTKISRWLSGLFVVGVATFPFSEPAPAQTQSQPDAQAPPPAAAPRITQAIDENNLLQLKGNVPPLALARYDQGAVADAYPLHRMLLLLQRGPDQQAALSQFMEQQQDKSSPNFHAWLTPQQFGQQFGPSDADIQTITIWLQSHGFQITNITAGRTLIEFSGTAGQVRSAFHTQIHNYFVNGQVHTANATDPQIPAALAPVVVGPVSLNNFPISSHLRQLGSFHRAKDSALAQPVDKPLYTFPGCTPSGCFGLGPADFATIYNSAPLLNGSPKIDGTGQTIAIVGESDIDPTDVTDFQTMFGITPNFSAANNIIVNGADPGFNGSEGESDLDVQWASAVAPGATVKFVTSEPTETTGGIFLSAIYIVENNFAGVMSESFGACEQQIGTLNQFHNTLWEQAAAQGITVFLSAGDGGSAGCDNFDTAQTATQGLAVSGFASTPFNVAVGGTDFDEIGRWTQYWSSTNNSPNESSALRYIPEIPWNQNCAQLGLTGCGASAPNGSLNIVAGSGGVSTLYAKPSWQSGTGVPNDGHRDLPDVSLFASAGFDGSFYIICQKDATGVGSCNLNEVGFTFQGVGGTSASSPAFAGIMALVNQSQAVTAGTATARQGNANYALYALFKKQTTASPALNCAASAPPSSSCTFYDVTAGNSGLSGSVGTNSVACAGGSPNCSTGTSGGNGVLVVPTKTTTEAYTATSGYDLAAGLGSVNIANLVNNWSNALVFKQSNTTLSATVNGQSASSITGTHGSPVNVTSTVAASQSGAGTPTGAVSLLATPNPNPSAPGASLGFDVLTLSNGTATGNSVVLPGGQYNLTAHYQGDGNFGASDSQAPGIPVNISAEPSKTLISIPTFDGPNNQENGNTPSSFVYGLASYLARIDVGNAQATLSFPPQPACTPPACPTGTITWTDSLNGGSAVPLDGGIFSLNSQGFTEDQLISLGGGNHLLTAAYSGDDSFGKSSATYAITITPAPTSQQWTNSASFVVVNQPFALGTAVGTGIAGVSPTGTVTFLDGTNVLPGTVTYMAEGVGSNVVLYANTTTSLATGGTHSITASYSGDANYGPSTSSPVSVLAKYPVSIAQGESATSINYGQTITATAVVTGNSKGPALSGVVQFTGTYTAISGPVNAVTGTDANGNPTLTATVSTTPLSSEQIFVNYANDPNYAGTTTIGDFISVNIPDFNLSLPPAIAVMAGQTGATTITVTPLSNMPSPVTLGVVGEAPGGMSLTFSPPTANLNGSPVPVTVSLSTTGPSGTNGAMLTYAKITSIPESWKSIGVVPLTSMLTMSILFGMFARHRRYRASFFTLVACIIAFAPGCGGGGSDYSGGGGGGGSSGPAATSISVTTSNGKIPSSGGSFTVTATITSTSSKPITGTVLFSAAQLAFPYPNGVPVVNGTASYTVNVGPGGLQFPVGTYSVTAQYSGDSNNLSSQTTTGANEVFTGTTSVTVIGNTASLSHETNIAVTLQ